jgi:hypothetical protein
MKQLNSINKMENQISYDLVDQIIRQMKELNLLLEKKLKEIKNEKQCKTILQN